MIQKSFSMQNDPKVKIRDKNQSLSPNFEMNPIDRGDSQGGSIYAINNNISNNTSKNNLKITSGSSKASKCIVIFF